MTCGRFLANPAAYQPWLEAEKICENLAERRFCFVGCYFFARISAPLVYVMGHDEVLTKTAGRHSMRAQNGNRQNV